MKIDCLMGTYGRHALACEAVACFLEQSAMSQATLLIYNQHPVPLKLDHPRVRIVNETAPAASLRFIRRRMLDLAEPTADLIHFWDDDDLYLPWHLEDCLNHIGDHAAWKPTSSWASMGDKDWLRHRNRFEGSWIFRADYLQRAPLDGHPTYTDHPVFLQAVESGHLATTELGAATSYIYRWATGAEHVSAYGAAFSQATQCHNIELWRDRSNDVPPDGHLIPADLTPRWREYLKGIRHCVSDVEWQVNRRRLPPYAAAPSWSGAAHRRWLAVASSLEKIWAKLSASGA